MEINIENIKLAVDMTMDITSKRHALIPVVARKMKCSEIELMQFIKNNPKLFHTETIFSYKTVKVRRRLFANDPKSSYTTENNVKNKNLGLGILNVYLLPEMNFRTEEWLSVQIEKLKKYLFVSEADNYGYIQGYYLTVDMEREDDKHRCYAWRNTIEKINYLKEKGYTYEGSFVFGGFGDSYTSNYENVITDESIEKLKSEGWTFNDFRKLSK